MSVEHLSHAALRGLPAVSDVEAFLVHEAELLDNWDLAAWLDLFTADAVYWLPTSRDQVSGHEQVSHIYDDRRLLETRVRRAQHALFHAQKPPSQTVHLVGNVRFPEAQPGDAVAVLSNQVIVEYRNARTRLLSGTCRHELVGSASGPWRIRLKRLDLIDADGVHEGISIIV
jgi:3-phenylpropionate/cinnamic acid dioxygenase small subunit